MKVIGLQVDECQLDDEDDDDDATTPYDDEVWEFRATNVTPSKRVNYFR